MRGLLLLVTLLSAARGAAALTADDVRGGWESYDDKPLRILEFSIRGDQVRGIYCTNCSDATTLAFINGKLDSRGLTYTVTHVTGDGSTAFQDRATATLVAGQLVVSGNSGAPGGGDFKWTLRKDPRGPAPVTGTPVNRLPPGPPVPPAEGERRPAPPYTQPGPWEPLTVDKVAGVWLGFGVGIDKQFFIMRKVGNTLRGMVCGRCDNPYTMGALDDFKVEGDTVTFNILHEDWGPGALPSHNQVTAHISQNEMRLSTRLDNQAPGSHIQGFQVQASLLGPVAIEATKR